MKTKNWYVMKMEFLALGLATLVCLLLVGVEGCADGWLSYRDKCIGIISGVRPGDTWSLNSKCAASDGELASISSKDMLDFLRIHAKHYKNITLWVGLRTQKDELVWMDGVPAKNQTWVQAPTFNGCYAFRDMVVEGVSCSTVNAALCSRSIQIIADVCSDGLLQYSFIHEVSGICFFRTPDSANYYNSQEICASRGGNFLELDEIITEGLSSIHGNLIFAKEGWKFWTNLKVHGGRLVSPTREENRWISTASFIAGRGECVTASFSLESSFALFLHQTECGDYAHVACAARTDRPRRIPAPAPLTLNRRGGAANGYECPEGSNWKLYPNTAECFWETSFETERLSWEEAQEYCQGYGGELASFHSTDEEKIGLSFQYGSLAHPYWIGLRYDIKNGTYKWSDGTRLNYENWAPGHPNHRDKRLLCVAMDAAEKHWVSAFCGILSWFVCKVSASSNHPMPKLPPRTPLPPCDPTELRPSQFYHKGYCYSVQSPGVSWHRAKESCQNQGSQLVSIHNNEELAFILRLLYESKRVVGNRMWIGLNSLRSDSFEWTDWSPVDFTFWSKDEPNNNGKQEKCCTMYVNNGLWNDEICNQPMGYICKQNKDANVTYEAPTTVDPTLGNCRKGWLAYHDRCYLPVGYSQREWANHTQATKVCQTYGGYLVSIRSKMEQAYVSYLMQGLKYDTWIGLQNSQETGSYFWQDNSDLRHTNWAPGEPSFFGVQEDCVKMSYDEVNSGVWRDDICSGVYPYICYTAKDPSLPKPEYSRGVSCIYPEGWLKLEHMCLQMFAGNPMTWREAEKVCEREGAHLVSVLSTSVQAAVSYLGLEVNKTFWIGLQYEEESQEFKWLSGWPLQNSHWANREPKQYSGKACFASSADGHWSRMSCEEKLPFLCHISPDSPPAKTKYRGECIQTSRAWIPGDDSYCYLPGTKPMDWFSASIDCFKHGATLLSIHSLQQSEDLRKVLKPAVTSVHIGLTVFGSGGGYVWSDNTPTDFVNWEEGMPENDHNNCVELRTNTLKWRTSACFSQKHFVCVSRKMSKYEESPESARLNRGDSTGLSAASWAAIAVCSVIAVAVIVGAVYIRPSLGRSGGFRNFTNRESLSYENALYKADSASMEFQNDRRNSTEANNAL